MIRQTVMGFKLERTEEKVTARSGLVLYAEFMEAMGVEGLVDQHMPKPVRAGDLKPRAISSLFLWP